MYRLEAAPVDAGLHVKRYRSCRSGDAYFPKQRPGRLCGRGVLRLIVGSGVYSDEVGHWFGNEAGHLFLFDSGATIPIFSRPIDAPVGFRETRSPGKRQHYDQGIERASWARQRRITCSGSFPADIAKR